MRLVNSFNCSGLIFAFTGNGVGCLSVGAMATTLTVPLGVGARTGASGGGVAFPAAPLIKDVGGCA